MMASVTLTFQEKRKCYILVDVKDCVCNEA